MAKTPINELPIHVYIPMGEGRKHIAQIANLPMLFKGDSPLKARMAAQSWADEQVAKMDRAEAAKIKRSAKAKEARKRRAEGA